MKVVSFNFNNLLAKRISPSKAWRRRLDNLIVILKTVNPDILAAQEIMSVADLAYLARRLQMHYSSTAWHSGGMCILSRYVLEKTVVKNIPDSYHNALVLAYTGNIWIASIHLFSEEYKRCEDTRVKETEWLLQQMQKYGSGQPCVMAGDWNSPTSIRLKGDKRPILSCSIVKEKPASSLLAKAKERKKGRSQCENKSCNPSSLPEKQLVDDGWKDAHVQRQVSTWIPAKKVERIDRIHFKDLQWKRAGIVGPEHLPSTVRWPTGKDHKLIFADFIHTFSRNVPR